MSRAFVNEDQAAAQASQPVERRVSDQPNYVTASGLAQLQQRVAELNALRNELMAQGERADKQRLADSERDLRYFSARVQSAQVVPAAHSTEKVQIGSRVTFVDENDQQHTVQLVGKTRPTLRVAWSTGAHRWAGRCWVRGPGMKCCGDDRWEISRSRSSASKASPETAYALSRATRSYKLDPCRSRFTRERVSDGF